MKILHVLYQSYPNISGSSTRSSAILQAQKDIGLVPVVLTSPFQKGVSVHRGFEFVDGIKYYRSFVNKPLFELAKPKSFLTRLNKLFHIIPYFFLLYKIAKSEKVEVIHSHAMFFNALPSLLVSKLLNVPHVYEVRSDWSNNSNFDAGSYLRLLSGFVEKTIVKLSGNLVVISQGLYEKYKDVCRAITIVPNAVQSSDIESGKSNRICLDKDELVIAYIGSVIALEGLSHVLEALKILNEEGFRLIIAGDGAELENIKMKSTSLGLKKVTFLGQVSREQVKGIYGEIDIVINYRVDEPVAHSVTPLKPLEAMAYRRLVVSSDVRGMTELIKHMDNGVVIPAESPETLACALENIRLTPELYEPIASRGAVYVAEEKCWSHNAVKYKTLYDDLLLKH